MNPPNNHRGPNGAGPVPRPWTPQERMVWLNSHNAPAHFRLCTLAELAILQTQFDRAVVLDREFAAVVHVLNYWDHWQQFPDVRHAVNAAAFNARKLERAANKAEETIADALQVFDLVIPSHPEFASRADALLLRGKLEETLAFIRAQKAAVPPTPPAQQSQTQSPKS